MNEPVISRQVARLLARREGGTLVPVALAVPEEVLATHSTPGQYVSIAAGGEEGFFVLASPVGAAAWELLVRASGAVSEALLAAPIGATFGTSAALGEGFPMADARARALILLAAGTGIAAVTPILAQRMVEGDAPRTDVFLGLRVAADLPCAREVAAWRSAGARVTVCVSREEPSQVGVMRGYVQDVAGAYFTPRAGSVSGGLMFAIGPDPMIAGARVLAKALGVPEADFRTNY
jgi:NAD(P)H-flavin reductase